MRRVILIGTTAIVLVVAVLPALVVFAGPGLPYFQQDSSLTPGQVAYPTPPAAAPPAAAPPAAAPPAAAPPAAAPPAAKGPNCKKLERRENKAEGNQKNIDNLQEQRNCGDNDDGKAKGKGD